MPLPMPHQRLGRPLLLSLPTSLLIECVRQSHGAITWTSKLVSADRESAVCATEKREGIGDAGRGGESCYYVQSGDQSWWGVVSEVAECGEIDEA